MDPPDLDCLCLELFKLDEYQLIAKICEEINASWLFSKFFDWYYAKGKYGEFSGTKRVNISVEIFVRNLIPVFAMLSDDFIIHSFDFWFTGWYYGKRSLEATIDSIKREWNKHIMDGPVGERIINHIIIEYHRIKEEERKDGVDKHSRSDQAHKTTLC